MKIIAYLVLSSILLVASPTKAALFHYTGDFSPVPGGAPISGSLAATLDATWNTETLQFENIFIEFSSPLPASTILLPGLLSIDFGYEYFFNLPMRTLADTCCGPFFDSTTGYLDFRIDSSYDASFATLVDSPSNNPNNSVLAMAAVRAGLGNGFIDFKIWDVFEAPGTSLNPTGLPALQASFVPPIAASDYPDRIPVEISAVPLPAAVWLFGTALIGLLGFNSRRKS